MQPNIHLQIYELTKKINELLVSDASRQDDIVRTLIKKRGTLIKSLTERVEPGPLTCPEEVRQNILKLEEENLRLLQQKISDNEQAVKTLLFAKKILSKYSLSIYKSKLLDLTK